MVRFIAGLVRISAILAAVACHESDVDGPSISSKGRSITSSAITSERDAGTPTPRSYSVAANRNTSVGVPPNVITSEAENIGARYTIMAAPNIVLTTCFSTIGVAPLVSPIALHAYTPITSPTL